MTRFNRIGHQFFKNRKKLKKSKGNSDYVRRTKPEQMTELSTTIGLANLGNTCFLNVVIQALRLSPPLCIMLLSDDIKKRKGSNKEELLDALQKLIYDFWKSPLPAGSKPTLMPRAFHNTFLKSIKDSGDDWHSFGQQSDAAETIQYILGGVHDATYKTVTMNILGDARNDEEKGYISAIESWRAFFGKEYSAIVENYHGQTQTAVICENCQAVSTRYEPWLMLKVPMPGGELTNRVAVNASLTDCLNLAFADDSLDDYHCDKCNTNGKAIIRNRISKLPYVIILTFKRFTNTMNKVLGKITWDADKFDFGPWMAFGGDPFNRYYTPHMYDTTALIEHQGSFRGGHYLMYAKQEKQWYEYDDNTIRNVPGETAMGCDAYIAFLTRKNKVEPMNQMMLGQIRSLRESQATPKAAAEA